MKLYHADVFIPAALRAQAAQTKFKKLIWSRHAGWEIIHDKYGMIPAEKIPHTFDAAGWTLVELEATDKNLTKYVFRRPVDSWRSLVIVIRPVDCGEKAYVVTAWTNRTDDKHASLDRTKYEPDHGAAQDRLWETHGID